MLNQEQQDAVTHIYETGKSFIIGQMGSGKTIVALTAADELLRDDVVKRVLVVGPSKPITDVWPKECDEWEHIAHALVVCEGPPHIRVKALKTSAKIIGVSFSNLKWLLHFMGLTDNLTVNRIEQFDMIIVDEVTKLKAGGAIFKELRACLNKFKVRVVMSANPVSENMNQLFYQQMIVDEGEAFGTNKQVFLNNFFFSTDQERRVWQLSAGMGEQLMARMAKYLVELPDYVKDLPALHIDEMRFDLSPADYIHYNTMKSDSVLKTGTATQVVADNEAILKGKLTQIACGFVYDDKDKVHHIHDEVQNMLAHITLRDHLIVVYQFREELKRALKMFKHARVLNGINDANVLAWFREDGDKVLLIHPRSAGHGLDLTASHAMVFMSPIWSRDLWRQTIGRIWRRGQKHEVHVIVLIGRDTVHEEMLHRSEIVKAKHFETLKDGMKSSAQEAFTTGRGDYTLKAEGSLRESIAQAWDNEEKLSYKGVTVEWVKG